MTDFSRLWMFNCGSPVNYVIDAGEGGDEKRAMDIATAYSKQRGIRPPATVRPFIAADPSILVLAQEVTHAGATPVEATTGFIGKVKEALGR